MRLRWHLQRAVLLQGEARALQDVVNVVDQCLREGGCQRVPGLPEEQYFFTLILSVAGGIILGFSLRLQPADAVGKRWLWPLMFSPLWGALFFSFGLGPVLSRTTDLVPVAQNTGAFLLSAYLFNPRPFWSQGPTRGDLG